jgi:glutamyl-tRNA synthetase
VRGEIEQDANRNDAVILKSSDEPPRLPTYHFAHVVDDHLMRVSLVVRAEEWIASVPLHLQLFAALRFLAPPYAHIAPLMKTEGSSRRKLSKRRDPEADVGFYGRAGYPARAVVHYLRGLFNARLADLGFAEAAAMPLVLDEAGVAGPLVDLAKLESVARDWIAELTAEEAHGELTAWAREHDPVLARLLDERGDLARRALAVERAGARNPRKDLARWSDFRRLYGFFFAELFTPVPPDDGRYAPVPPDLVRTLAAAVGAGYRDDADAGEWFGQMRAVATAHGFAPGVREHRAEPGRYRGSIRDVANVVRVALTGATRSPDLYEVACVLGRDEVVRRLGAVAAAGG